MKQTFTNPYDKPIEAVYGLPVQTIECPTHEIILAPPFAGPVNVSLAPRDTIPNKDFVPRDTAAGRIPETWKNVADYAHALRAGF